jgi:ATP-dependent Clp protease ATP-binding subunit ClpB
MEIDSVPIEIDVIQRRIVQLEIEKQALVKEDDASSRQRLAGIESELADLNEEADRLRAHWQAEKEGIQAIRGLKQRIENTRIAAEKAQRAGELEKAAELQYGKLAVLTDELEQREAELSKKQATQRARAARGRAVEETGHAAHPEGGGRRRGYRRGGLELDRHSGRSVGRG